MNASDVISKLKRLVDQHGDLPVTVSAEPYGNEAILIGAFDKEGNGPNDKGHGPMAKFRIFAG